jgi:FecR protein
MSVVLASEIQGFRRWCGPVMTDERAKTGIESDVSVERMLTDTLITPPLDEDGIERMRVAVAQEWLAAIAVSRHREASIRRRWRLGLAAAAGFTALIVGIWSMRPTGESMVIGSLARLNDGGVEIRSGLFQHRALQVGEPLRVGDTLMTRGLALLTLARGGTLRVGAGSRLSVNQPTQLSLERGLMYVDMPPGSTASNPLRVMTRAGVIEHLGTEFEVMSDQQLVRIRVPEGQIRISRGSAVWVADAGTELLATRGDQFSQRPFATFGRDWLWIAALAPDYQIEGQPLIGFLRWVSRELGRPLDFADAHAREVADSTILHGSLHGQEPLVALATVLATTSLTYELRGDRVWVHSGP